MRTTTKDTERRAMRLLQRGKQRAAIAVLTVGVCRDSSAGNLWLMRALIHHAERKWPTALSDVEHAMTLMPLPVSGQLVLADCYSFTGHKELALLAYEQLLRCEDAAPKVYAAVYAGLKRCERSDLALECCRVAVRANPDDHAAYFAMAHCMALLGYSATYVASVLESAVEHAPERDPYRVSLAMQLTRCGRVDDAYEHLRKASIDTLGSLTCACSVRRLLELCLWAGDGQRSDALCKRLNQLDDCNEGAA